jgi:hypothetical protein
MWMPEDEIGRCPCGNRFVRNTRGRPRKFCDQTCRQAAYVTRRRLTKSRGGSQHDGFTQRRLNEVRSLVEQVGLEQAATMHRTSPDEIRRLISVSA